LPYTSKDYVHKYIYEIEKPLFYKVGDVVLVEFMNVHGKVCVCESW